MIGTQNKVIAIVPKPTTDTCADAMDVYKIARNIKPGSSQERNCALKS